MHNNDKNNMKQPVGWDIIPGDADEAVLVFSFRNQDPVGFVMTADGLATLAADADAYLAEARHGLIRKVRQGH